MFTILMIMSTQKAVYIVTVFLIDFEIDYIYCNINTVKYSTFFSPFCPVYL